MSKGFWECLKWELGIIKPKLSGIKMGFMCTPALNCAGFSLQELKNAERFLIDLWRQIAVTLLGLILGESVLRGVISSFVQ